MSKSTPQKLQALRDRAGLSLDELARRMGYRRASSIQRYVSEDDFRGEYLSVQMARKFANVLAGRGDPAITDAEILALAGPDVQSLLGMGSNVPVVSFVEAGRWSETADPYPKGHGSRVVACDSHVSDLAFALQLSGQSMEPRFQNGDLVIIDPAIPPIPGDFVVAKLKNDEMATFKQYRQRSPDEIELRPLNELFPILTLNRKNPGKIIGPMIEHHSYRQAGRI